MSPPPHGCTLTPGIVPDHLAVLQVLRDEVAWTGHMASRHTASMGVPYNYSGASYPVAAWHPAVAAIAEQIAPLVGFVPTNCLLNYYPTGRHSLGWHSDDVSILAEGTGVGIVSLGTTRELRLRAGSSGDFHYESIPLVGGSLLLMNPGMQSVWRHAIRRSTTGESRLSLSFRHIVRWPERPPPVPPRSRVS